MDIELIFIIIPRDGQGYDVTTSSHLMFSRNLSYNL